MPDRAQQIQPNGIDLTLRSVAWFGSPGSLVAPQLVAYRVGPITGRRSAKLSFCGAAIICWMLTRPATKQMINRRQRGPICFLSHWSCDLFAITMPVPLTRIGCVNGWEASLRFRSPRELHAMCVKFTPSGVIRSSVFPFLTGKFSRALSRVRT